ncbi:MAG: glycosyltransferase [Chitinophagaceae bacterium]|nr:glycosyltransferase [Chitinophagaceae bacterium]
MNCAPLLIFTFKRLETLKETIAALQKNKLAGDTEVFIFSDGAKKKEDIEIVEEIRKYLETIKGFKKVTIFAKPVNEGLANSIIGGVTKIINEYGSVIILEDDLVTSTNFLVFMNEALHYYENNKQIFSIAGYTPAIKGTKDDVYFTMRGSSWGWATWKGRWNEVSWEIKNYDVLEKDNIFRKEFNKMGSDMFKMLKDQMNGKINSWAIRWVYHQFRVQKYTVFPSVSKVQNIGMGKGATHTKHSSNRFTTKLDCSDNFTFRFIDQPVINNAYLKQFLKPYNLLTRVKYKIFSLLKF